MHSIEKRAEWLLDDLQLIKNDCVKLERIRQVLEDAALAPEGYMLVPIKITKEIEESLNESFEYGYSAESTWDLAIHASTAGKQK